MRNIDNSYAVKLASYLGHVNGLRVKQAFLESMDPTAQAALLAGGAGAAVGGIGNALFGKRKKGVGMLGRLGRGALAGGGIGALAGGGINEAAIRSAMGNTGNTRDSAITALRAFSGQPDESQMPVDYATSRMSDAMYGLKGYMNKLLYGAPLTSEDNSDETFVNQMRDSYREGKEEELKLNLPNYSTPGPNYGSLPPGSPTGPLADLSTRPDLSDILGIPQGPLFKNSPFPLEKHITQDFRNTVNESFKKDPRYGTNFFRNLPGN